MPSVETIKMEERKRPAVESIDTDGPPSKRQALAVNGSGGGHPDADMPWKDDIENFQKDAILRQMRVYKREISDLQSRLDELAKQSTYHDDHLRIVDAWFGQLLEEISIVCDNFEPVTDTERFNFLPSLFTAGNDLFESHLVEKSDHIKNAINKLFSRLPFSSPASDDLEERLSNLLATEQQHLVELQRLNSDRDQLQERLENASFRYMMAEKKADRLRSAQVTKLEAQAMSIPKQETPTAPELKRESPHEGGDELSLEVNEAAEASRREAVAVADERARQLEKMSEENQRLLEALTAAQIKASGSSEEDYANSDLYKAVKSQHENIIKRINDLEATNIQLRNEAKQLQAERIEFKDKTADELRNQEIDMEGRCAKLEADLSRVRTQRDGFSNETVSLKSAADKQAASYEQLKELSDSREARIEALESELKRLQLEIQSSQSLTESQNEEGLGARIQDLEKQKTMLETELQSMEAAWKKASAAGSKKIADTTILESKLAKALAEKTKADQKYFATMKTIDLQKAELKVLKMQNGKTSEIVAQLKEAEGSCRALLVNLEKQNSDAKDSLGNLTNTQRSTQTALSEAKAELERFRLQVAELKSALTSKDSTILDVQKSQRQAELYLASVNAKLEEANKSVESMKKKGEGGQTEEYEVLRQIALCTVCRKRFKNTAITKCGHVFCKECVDERYQNRSRKCPNCNRAFGAADTLHVTL